MRPIPVTIVCGFLGAGKTTLIRRWLQAKPAAQRWVIVLNERGVSGLDLPDNSRLAASSVVTVVDLSAACACCVAQPLLRRELPRVVSQQSCDRLIIELSGQAQPQRIADLLRTPELRASFHIERIVSVIAADRASVFRRLDDPDAPVLARTLARSHIEIANQTWLRTWQPDDEDQALARRLRGASPFGRMVEFDPASFDDHCSFAVDRPTRMRQPQIGYDRHAERWCWPAQWRLSRLRFVRMLSQVLPYVDVPWCLHALLITERETYEWRVARHKDDDSIISSATLSPSVSAYRTMSRIDVAWQGDPTPGWLAALTGGIDGLAV